MITRMRNGVEGERQERQKIKDEEREAMEQNLKRKKPDAIEHSIFTDLLDMLQLRDNALKNRDPSSEPAMTQFSPEMESFRDSMLQKIGIEEVAEEKIVEIDESEAPIRQVASIDARGGSLNEPSDAISR